MADLISLYNFARQGADEGKARGIQSLIGKAAANPADRQRFLGMAAQSDPKAAFDAQKFFADDDGRKRTEVAKRVSVLMAMPQEQRAQMYASMAPEFQAMGIPAPAQYDPSFDEPMKAIAAAYGGGAGGNNVQSRFVGEDGMVYAMLRDGSVQQTGIKADRQMWLRDQPGIAPSLIGKDGVMRPLQEGGTQMAQPPMQQAPVAEASGMPVQFTDAEAVPEYVQAAIRANPDGWGSVPDGGGAVLPPRNVSPQNVSMPAQQGLAAARPAIAPAEAARLDLARQANQRAMGQYDLAVRAAERADRAEARASQPKPGKGSTPQANAIKSAQVQNVDRGLQRIDKALKALEGGLADTGPVDQFVNRFTNEGRELEAAVGGIQNSMLALTRVPGIGAQSDLEAKIAALQYPSLGMPMETNRATLQNLRQFVNDLKQALQATPAPAQPAAQPASDIDALLDMYR